MINIATNPDPSHINYERLDRENSLKEVQRLMPLVKLLRIKASPDTLMGLERDQKLRIMGFTEREVEEMTGFKQREAPDIKETDLAVVEIFAGEKDPRDKWKEAKARMEAEWKADLDRIFKDGSGFGLAEVEFGADAKLKTAGID